MTEADWLACGNPNFALMVVRVKNPSRRKARLAAAGGLRHFWDELSSAQRRAVAAAEGYADGRISYRELRAATARPGRPTHPEGMTLGRAVERVTHRVAADALWTATMLFLPAVYAGPVYTHPPFPDARAFAERGRPMLDIFRCVYGNPFRPVTFDAGWRTTAALAVAGGVYDDRAFDRLPILADALEDAGCQDADVLAHCRGPGSHARGCWVVDAVLGRA